MNKQIRDAFMSLLRRSSCRSVRVKDSPRKTVLVLLGVVVLGLVAYTIRLDRVPPALNWDEAAIGYNAYALMLTGKDEYGEKLPVQLRSFDDYKPALSAYLVVPVMKVLGRGILPVRLPFAVLGALSLVWIYLLGSELFGDRRVGLVASILAIFEMWHFSISRGAFEAGVGLFWFLGGSLALIRAREKRIYLVAAVVAGLAAFYSYHSFRLIIPVLWGVWFFLGRKSYLRNKKMLVGLVVFVVIAVMPLLWGWRETGARFGETNIFKFWPKSNLLTGVVGESGIPWWNLAVSPVYFFVWELAGRWLAYYSPANLALPGEVTSGFYVPTLGGFYVWEVPFWIAGIYFLFTLGRKKKEKESDTGLKLWQGKGVMFGEILAWMVLGSLPAVVTGRWFHLLRAVALWPLYSCFVALGLVILWEKGKRTVAGKLIWIAVLAVIAGFGIYALETYFVYLPKANAGDWQYGFGEMVPYVANIEKDYKRVVVDSPHQQPQIFFLFYQGYSPVKYQEELKQKGGVEKPRKNFDFGRYVFRDIYWPEDRKLGRTLWVGSPDALPVGDIAVEQAKILRDFYDMNGNITFRVVETK